MAPNRTIPSRQPTGRDTLAAPIGILPRREGRPGESTPVSYGIAATVSARVRDTREGQAPRPPPVGLWRNRRPPESAQIVRFEASFRDNLQHELHLAF